ncbi:MAG: recombinase family protein [Patescibacteria group bacterium]
MKYGYARVSTQDQNLNLQTDALQKEGVEKENFFTDFISGSKFERKGLNQLLEKLQAGDVLVVWKLDRLGRSLKELINLIDKLKEKGVDIQSVQDKLDTTTPMGKLIFHINCAYAEFEREIIKERTKAGLAAARERGKMGGRPDKLGKADIEKLKKLYRDGKTPIADLKKWFSVSNNTLYRYVKK